MVISYFGDSCFRLQSGDASCLIDPQNARQKADLVIRTRTPLVNVVGDLKNETISNRGEIFFGGEYDVAGWEVQGFSTPVEKKEETLHTSYLITRDDITLFILNGNVHTFDADTIERIGEPDFMIVTEDDKGVITPEVVVKFAKQFLPYRTVLGASNSAEKIAKTLGKSGEIEEKLVVKKKDLVGERGKTVILKNE